MFSSMLPPLFIFPIPCSLALLLGFIAFPKISTSARIWGIQRNWAGGSHEPPRPPLSRSGGTFQESSHFINLNVLGEVHMLLIVYLVNNTNTFAVPPTRTFYLSQTAFTSPFQPLAVPMHRQYIHSCRIRSFMR